MAVSMYSMTSQQDPSPATSGADYLKRPLHHDLQAEVESSDFEPALKMKCSVGAGGGRRKQSKPIRVRSDVEAGPVEDLIVDMKLPVNNTPSARDSSPAATDTRQVPTVEAVSYEVDDGKPDSAGLFPTKYHQLGSELKQEVGLGSYEPGNGEAVDSEGVKSVAERSDAADVGDLKRSPGRYFDRHETDFKLDTKPLNRFSDNFYKASQGAQSPTSLTADCLPTNLSVRSIKSESPGLNADVYSVQPSSRALLSDVDIMSQADMQEADRFWDCSDGAAGLEKSRIFHPDAYCDICDREFCNKYFLKTHRANKHGIYDGSSGDPVGNSSSGTLPPVSGSVSGIVFPPQAGLGATEVSSVSLETERATPNSLMCSSAASLPGVLPIPQLPSSFGMLPFDDAPLPPPPPPPQHQPPVSRVSDMEDYCDICQKHFCNKYYLRKHRQDVHGLSPADVATRRVQGDADTPHFPLRVASSTAPSSLPAPPPSALSNFPMFLPPPFGAPLPVVSPFLPGAAGLPFGSLQFGPDGHSSKLSTSSTSSSGSQPPQQQLSGTGCSLLPSMLSADAYMDMFRKELLGGYLMNNGDRDMTAAAFAAVAAAAAASSGDHAAGIAPPRLPPIPSSAELHAPPSLPIKLETGANPTPDTFAEMLQRIGARIGKKNDGLGGLPHDLFRLNGLGLGPRLPGSLASTAPPSSSSSSSSRLVDRVVCDLCNKEVCNKYFLKTHKMKVHGWDPNTSTVMSSASNPPTIAVESGLNKSVSSTQPQPPLIYHPPLTDSQMEKLLPFPLPESSRLQTPKEVELQQMGIDPEAYCEICRKEFCSKYFLRTHRQNIHGIHDTSRSSSPGAGGHQGQIAVASGAGSAPLFSSAGPFSSVVLAPPVPPPPPPHAVVCLPSSLPVSVPSTCVSSSMFLFGAGLATNESSSGSSDGHMAEQRSWKWKEPVNATRVSCTLCNKVLCNKYFLRTHMAKRHGVTVDTRLLPPQAPVLPGGPLAMTPVPTNGVAHQSPADCAPPVDEIDHKDATDGACVDPGKTGAVNLVLTGNRASSDVQTVTARTWHVPPDDTTSTPQSDVTGSQQTPESSSTVSPASTKQLTDDAVKCPLCAAAMSDREVLQQHLTSIHHVDEQMTMSLVDASSISPASSSSDGFLPHHPSQLPRTPTGVTGAGTVRRRRQFRCAYCRERFRTRVHCELHARAAHPRATGSCVEVTPAVESVDVAPSTPPPPVSIPLPQGPVYATPLDADDAARAQMLPFILRQSVSQGCQPLFSTALVYLPTFRRLTSPTNVSFSLTPVLQP